MPLKYLYVYSRDVDVLGSTGQGSQTFYGARKGHFVRVIFV